MSVLRVFKKKKVKKNGKILSYDNRTVTNGPITDKSSMKRLSTSTDSASTIFDGAYRNSQLNFEDPFVANQFSLPFRLSSD